MTTTFTITARVYNEDTDYGGIVYHPNYLKYMERARTEWLNHVNVPLSQLEKEGFLFVIREIKLEYLKPAKLDDLLEISARISHIGNSSMSFAQTVSNKENTNYVYCQAEIQMVCINKNNLRPTRIPLIIREIFGREAV